MCLCVSVFLYMCICVCVCAYIAVIPRKQVEGGDACVADVRTHHSTDSCSDGMHTTDGSMAGANEEEEGKYNLIIVELNSYSTSTGGSMFDWSTDKEVLEGSSISQQKGQQTDIDTIEFRLGETYLENLHNYLEMVMLPH